LGLIEHPSFAGNAAAQFIKEVREEGDVYERLGNLQVATWKGGAHFFAISAQWMRRILVDGARSRPE
jgi:hypothetical protein